MAKPNPKIATNFFKDYAEIARRRLTAAGYAVVANEPDEDSLGRFLNVLHRRVLKASRKSYKANDFYCPPEHEAGLKLLLENSEAGNDLRANQSTLLDKANFNDAMLNDWGIQHLHLGVVPYARNPAFIDRTGPVLYAIVRPDALYCIRVMRHGEWSNQKLLESVNKNWPELHAHSVVKASGGLQPDGLSVIYSDENVAKLRSVGVNAITQRSDGTIQIGPGGGVSTNKKSMEVTKAGMNIRKLMQGYEKIVTEQVEALEKKKQTVGPFEFKLVEENGFLYAFDEKTGLKFKLSDMVLHQL